MAKTMGNSGVVKQGAYEVAEVTKFDLTETPVIVSDVAVGDTWATSTAGTKSWSGSIECFYDVTDTTGQNALIAGNSVYLRLYPEGNELGKQFFYNSAIIGAVTKSVTKDTYVTATFPVTGVDQLREYRLIGLATPTGGTLTLTLTLSLPTGKTVIIDWGNNSTSTVTGPQTAQAYAKVYTAGSYNVALGGDYTSLTYLTCTNSIFSGDILDMAPLSGLTTLDLSSSGISTYTAGTLPAWGSATIDISDLGLSATEVDNFLADLDTAGGSSGTLDISGTNSAPTAAGLTSKGNLEGKGWSVTVTT